MTERRPLARALPIVLAVAGLVALAAAGPTLAASAVSMEARALLGGRYVAGGWAAISVTLVNEGSPTDGVLSATVGSATVQRPVEMPAGSRKVVTLHVRPGAFQRAVDVVYREPNGDVTASAAVQVLQHGQHHVALVGDEQGTIRAQLTAAGVGTTVVPLAPPDLPERPEPWEGFTDLVWAGDAGSLSEAQRRAVAAWVADGGRLTVLGGADWQARAGGFADLLPVVGLEARDDVPVTALAAWAATDPLPVETATVAAGRPAATGRVAVATDDGVPLVSWRPLGAGRVAFVAADLAAESLRGWSGGAAVWARLAPAESPVLEALGRIPDGDAARGSMASALDTLPALDLPAAELVLAVIVAYILLIGPISYVVLRRLDRRELAWVTAPLLVILFTGCSYGVGLAMRGTEVIVHEVSVVRPDASGGWATVATHAGIFSPGRATYEVVVDADALVDRVPLTFVDPTGGGQAPAVRAEQGVPARLHDLLVTTGFEVIRADGSVPYEPALDIDLQIDGERVTGTVTNRSDDPIDDVAYVTSSWGRMIGDLAPGQALAVDLDFAGFSQSSPSDQIYGFVGGSSGTEEGRRVATRRHVIDSLVGYAGWMAGGLTDLGATAGRGPYVIGWRATDGPMPVSLAGVETQRVSNVVEVVPARPIPAGSSVTLGPESLSVSVETEGDAFVNVDGVVTLAEGSATWTLRLPLEASGLVADELTIMAAPIPSEIMNAEGFRGLWPAGFVLEIRDRDGEWRQLGSLQESAVFPIDEPADVLSPDGAVVVRVVTEAGDETGTGQQNLFVSARVRGEAAP